MGLGYKASMDLKVHFKGLASSAVEILSPNCKDKIVLPTRNAVDKDASQEIYLTGCVHNESRVPSDENRVLGYQSVSKLQEIDALKSETETENASSIQALSELRDSDPMFIDTESDIGKLSFKHVSSWIWEPAHNHNPWMIICLDDGEFFMFELIYDDDGGIGLKLMEKIGYKGGGLGKIPTRDNRSWVTEEGDIFGKNVKVISVRNKIEILDPKLLKPDGILEEFCIPQEEYCKTICGSHMKKKRKKYFIMYQRLVGSIKYRKLLSQHMTCLWICQLFGEIEVQLHEETSVKNTHHVFNKMSAQRSVVAGIGSILMFDDRLVASNILLPHLTNLFLMEELEGFVRSFSAEQIDSSHVREEVLTKIVDVVFEHTRECYQLQRGHLSVFVDMGLITMLGWLGIRLLVSFIEKIDGKKKLQKKRKTK